LVCCIMHTQMIFHWSCSNETYIIRFCNFISKVCRYCWFYSMELGTRTDSSLHLAWNTICCLWCNRETAPYI
jgi:hypothetical protein